MCVFQPLFPTTKAKNTKQRCTLIKRKVLPDFLQFLHESQFVGEGNKLIRMN